MILAAFTAGCEKEIPFEGEDARTRVVFHSFLEPNNLILVNLTESRSVLENDWGDYPPVLGATIKVFKNETYIGDLQEDQVNNDGSYYYAEVVEAGSSYRFEVTHPTLEGVECFTHVPELSPQFTAEIIDTINFNWVLEVTVTDIAPGPTFFLMDLSWSWPPNDNQMVFFSSTDPFLKTPFSYTDPVDPYQYFDGEAFFTDDHFQNGSYTFRIEFYADQWSIDQYESLDVRIKHMSRDLYLYQFSGQLQQWVDGDPFAQPAQVHNNIENGIGCLGSYHASLVQFDL